MLSLNYKVCFTSAKAYLGFGMNITDVIHHFGGKTKTARELGISYQAVQQWVEANKIPITRQYQIQVVTNGALKAAPNCSHLKQ